MIGGAVRRRRECRQVRNLLPLAVDNGPIDLRLRRHLRDCPGCRRRLDDQKRLSGMLRHLGSVVPLPPPVDRRSRAARRIVSGAGGVGIASVAALMVRQARKR